MISEKMLDDLRVQISEILQGARWKHTLGVEKEMRYYARIYMPENETLAAAAGLLHDITKCIPAQDHREYCAKNGISITEQEYLAPQLLHAKTGVHFIQTHFSDFALPEILSAVAKHTTADADMTLFDKLLYLADFTEEGRTYPDCIALRKNFRQRIQNGEDKIIALDETILQALDCTIRELLGKSAVISIATMQARNDLLTKKLKIANR